MSKTNKDSFGYLGDDFQIRLVAQLFLDTKFSESIIDIMDPNYFDEHSLKIIVSTIKEAYLKDNVIPDIESIQIRIIDNITNELEQKLFAKYLNKIKNVNLNDSLMIQEKAMKFCKQQELKKSIKEIQHIIDKGDYNRYDDCEQILKKALEHGDLKDNGVSVLENIDLVLADDFRKPIPTGIKGLDEIMDGGLSKGELAIILAPFGVGKAQPLFSKILTPDGWVKMSDINVGDYVISRDGKPTKVIGTYPQGKRPIYKIKFNDGTQTLCDAEHLWAVNSINQRNRKTKKDGKTTYLESDNSFKVVKTIDMIDNVKVWNGKRLNYKIPIVSPVEFTKKDLIIDPYLLGIILGDGCITTSNQPHFVTKDDEIISEVCNIYQNISIKEQVREIEKEIDGELVLVKRSLTKVSLLGIKEFLVKLNLYGTNSKTKFIPKEYLYSSISDRVSLLQGLVDTDGYIDAHRIEISTVSKQLSENIKELVLSLGGRLSISEKTGKYGNNVCNTYYRISFSFPDNGVIPSRLTRKLNKFKNRTKYSNNKFIESIDYYGEEEAKCIMVDNPEHLYVTDDYIVTHNTTMITKIANTAADLGKNVLQIFFEDQVKVIQRKHLSCWSGYDLNSLSLHKDEIKKIVEDKIEKNVRLKLKKFPSDGTTIPTIKQYIRKLIAKGFKPDILLLDYIDCVEPSKRFDDANVGEGSVMRQFETLLSEFDIAGWTAVQGNRSSIRSAVVESDQMGGSIKKGQIGHFVVSIAKTLDQKENKTATMAILKSRFGKDGMILEDIIFDNSRIQIDMNPNKIVRTKSEFNKDKEKEQNEYVSGLLNGIQKRKNAIGNVDENVSE
jgi:hypothetical protein